MIIPFYHQAVSRVTFPENVINKWYCSYHEERNGIKISRYLHPTGWKKYNYWWDTEEEVETIFNKIGQNRLKISDLELQNEIIDREEWQRMYWEGVEKDLEKSLTVG